jgi:hypothetical protein
VPKPLENTRENAAALMAKSLRVRAAKSGDCNYAVEESNPSGKGWILIGRFRDKLTATTIRRMLIKQAAEAIVSAIIKKHAHSVDEKQN